MRTCFGQLVLGPPGSGKTKYCQIIKETLEKLGRLTYVVNLDPANENINYDCQLNIFDLINIQDVMFNTDLGPNGSLIYCMEFLEQNVDWLIERLDAVVTKSMSAGDSKQRTPYFLFDLPGQIELYTHHSSVRNIIEKLGRLDYRLTCVNLIDSFYASEPAKFISVLFTSLNMMMQIELPHVNLLSKMDLYEQFGKAAFNLDYYTEVLDLKYLVDLLDSDGLFKRFKKLNAKLCDIIQDYSLVSFLTLNIQKQRSLLKCIHYVDKANGYTYKDMDDYSLMDSYAAPNEMFMDDDYDKNDNDNPDND